MRTMDGKAVREIREDMDRANTKPAARKALARAALARNNLTDCGRREWEKELND